MKHIAIVAKFLIILCVFGLMSTASVVFSTIEMRRIDEGYTQAIDRQGIRALYLARASRAVSQIRSAIADLEIATTDDGNRLAMDELKGARAGFLDLMGRAKAADPDEAKATDALIARGLAAVDESCAEAIKLGNDSTGAAAVAAAQALYLKACSPVFKPLIRDFTAAVVAAEAAEAKVEHDLSAGSGLTILTTYVSVLGGLAVVIAAAFFGISAWVSRPIKALSLTMNDLTQNDLSAVVVGTERKDEIGSMARAVQVFKDNGLKLRMSEEEAGRSREAADRERSANEAARAVVQREQLTMVNALASGLERLSKGDLTGRLNEAFTREYEKLRSDFNDTAASLQETMRAIHKATNGISSGSDEIAHASDDLSRRTEQQAASLEETAAALDVITATVKKMAAGAGEAAEIVATARSEAETSGMIVTQAVDAMERIKDSAQQISQIIGVIDEIAFQTNLLALNAGVEAARAGDAGRGFAVVASEVRGLAQRSAEAAKEIKALISASNTQVESGVLLVGKTGTALQGIIEKVATMDVLVRGISMSSQEQATGLAEVNVAVGQMDQVVQQNAAMVEESTAAAHALKSDTQALTTMMGRFQIGTDRANPVHAAQGKLASSFRR